MPVANNYGDEQVYCPFYEGQEKTYIKCEGDLEEEDKIRGVEDYRHLQFVSPASKDRWMNDYCTGFAYVECPMCKKISEKYREKERAK